MRLLGSLLLLICLSALPLRAQSPAASNTLPIPWRQQVFSIPFQVTRPTGQPDSPTEVQLYLSLDQGKSWRLAKKVPPQAGKFTFRAHADGEYWFAMRTLGANGLFLDNQPLRPGLRVFVDTSAPVLQLQGQRGESGEVELNWQVTDAGMDGKSLKLEYQSGPEEPWRPLSATGMRRGTTPGSYLGRATFYGGQTGGAITVRAEVSDVAGNRAVSQAKIPADGSPSSPANQATTNQIAANQAGTNQAGTNQAGTNQAGTNQAGTNQAGTNQAGNPARFASNPQANPRTNTPANPQAPARNNAPASSPLVGQANPQVDPRGTATGGTQNPFQQSPYRGQAPSNTVRNQPPGAAGQHISEDNVFQEQPAIAQAWPADKVARTPLEQSGPLPTGGEKFYAQRNPVPVQRGPKSSFSHNYGEEADNHSSSAGQGTGSQMVSQSRQDTEVYSPAARFELPPGVKVRMINSPAFELQYDVSTVGPSGVAGVELWGTRDGGGTWALFGEDPDRESPVPAEVKFDGVYGFRIVVHAGNGKSSPVPQPGDAPEVWVGVDLTMPTGEILAAESGENDINIRWTSADAYPSAKPVTLSYSATPAGPWTQITTGQPSQGAYTWKPTRQAPEAVFIQLQVTDQAGNAMRTVRRQTVALPHHRPQGRIRDVRPIAPSAARGGAWYR